MEDMAMRSLDFSPLFSSTVGFDRFFDLLQNASQSAAPANWPPYDIVKSDDDRYRIVMAVPGYSPEELNIVAEPGMLIVSGQRQAPDDRVELLHNGLVQDAFERRFELADYVKVSGAKLDSGLLAIELVRELPEAMKPRRIEIQAQASAKTGSPAPQVEHSSSKAAA
jgi:molecular chaperone IbpA